MNRRFLFKMAGALGAGKVAGVFGAPVLAASKVRASGKQKQKAQFKVLYGNDFTNILDCVSPYHKLGEADLTTAMIQASIDEAADADVQLFQPGFGWIPWWKSKIYPIEEHYRWVKQATGVDPDPIGRYLLAGNDPVQVFIDSCRKLGKAAFISYRVNDGHHLETIGTKDRYVTWVSRFYTEHPEYRLGPAIRDWDQRVHNWAIPEAREYKFNLIRELCQNYDIDGLELDFMRYTRYFRLNETTPAQRAGIIRDFVARVRGVLDETARGGRRRWLSVRVPSFLVAHDPLGIDLPVMVEAGVDIVNLSSYYFAIQQTDLAIVHKMVPEAAVYLEMTQETKGGYDDPSFLRTTDNEFYTGAELTYARGGDGVSLFNFAYYRNSAGRRGVGLQWNEPPFHVLKHLGDPEWLHKQAQWYVLATAWTSRILGDRVLPKTFLQGVQHNFLLDVAPGQNRQGVFRLRARDNAAACSWTIQINKKEALIPADYIEKPINHPYDAGLGKPENYACFSWPPGIAGDGQNELSITMNKGNTMVVEYLDLVLGV